MGRRIYFFISNQKGLAALEFALTLPLLMALFMGGVELTRYIIVAQKTEKAAITMSDLVAQSSDIGTTDLDILVEAVEQVMLPLSFGNKGFVIVSSISRAGSDAATINWQYTGGGTWTKSSKVGFEGGSASLPAGFSLDPNEGIIVAEVYYKYTPLFADAILPSAILYKVGVFKPRLGELTTLGS